MACGLYWRIVVDVAGEENPSAFKPDRAAGDLAEVKIDIRTFIDLIHDILLAKTPQSGFITIRSDDPVCGRSCCCCQSCMEPRSIGFDLKRVKWLRNSQSKL